MDGLFLTQTSGFPVTPESLDLFAIMQKGGLLMWLILLGSVIAVGVFFERLFYYRRSQMSVGQFLMGINSLLRKRSYKEAEEMCEAGFGPVERVVRQAIISRQLPPTELREVVKEMAQLQVPRLEANMSILATIGQVMPLIGLLGTVTGMIDSFIEIHRAAGAASVSEISSGIWTALITTAAGLAVAIPCNVSYNFLLGRLNQIISDMERAGIEVIHVLTGISERGSIEGHPLENPSEKGKMVLLPPEERIPSPIPGATAKVP